MRTSIIFTVMPFKFGRKKEWGGHDRIPPSNQVISLVGCVPMPLPFNPQISGPWFPGGFPFPMPRSVQEYLTTDVDLSGLNSDPLTFDFGGLGLKVTVQRYPEELEEETLSLEYTVESPQDKTTPYLLKVIQEDGHMAWSSPIWVDDLRAPTKKKK